MRASAKSGYPSTVYQRDMVRARLGAESAVTGKTVCNARISSHNQTEQRKTQASRLVVALSLPL